MSWAIVSDQGNDWSVVADTGYYVVADYCVDDYVEIDEPWDNESDKATVWQSL